MIFPGKELLSPDWFGSNPHPCRHSSCGTALYVLLCSNQSKVKNEGKKEEIHFKKKDKNEKLLKKTIQAKINLQENFSRLYVPHWSSKQDTKWGKRAEKEPGIHFCNFTWDHFPTNNQFWQTKSWNRTFFGWTIIKIVTTDSYLQYT